MHPDNFHILDVELDAASIRPLFGLEETAEWGPWSQGREQEKWEYSSQTLLPSPPQQMQNLNNGVQMPNSHHSRREPGGNGASSF